jgi:hypothetical protein
MRPGDAYRRKAFAALQLAQNASSATLQSLHLRIADKWLELADRTLWRLQKTKSLRSRLQIELDRTCAE